MLEAVLNAEALPSNKPKLHRRTKHSQHSQHSPAVHAAFALEPDEVEIYEERAAIFEFDGELSKDLAEVKALREVLAMRS